MRLENISSNNSSTRFHIMPICAFVTLILIYLLLSITSFANIILNRNFCFYLCVIMSILYLWNYRRHQLFCFETFFFPLYILSLFFTDIVLHNLPSSIFVSPVAYTSFSDEVENKGLIVQLLGFFGFMSAASYKNYRANRLTIIFDPVYYQWEEKVNWNLASNILGIGTLLYILFLYLSGVVSTWFHYSGNVTNYANTEIIYCTTLCLATSLVELTRLHQLGCENMRQFVRTSNKIVLIDILSLFVVLVISGNRNESLLILLPFVVFYSSFIHHISNKTFFLGSAIGLVLMIVVGVARQTGSFSKETEISLYEMTRDFGAVDMNTRYLVSYVDDHSFILFKNAFLRLVSSVPFLGGLIIGITGLSDDIHSPELTTAGMQLSSNLDSGLGTSLIGDLYYTGGFVFMLLFMCFYGWLVASLDNRFSRIKDYNPWLLILYAFNFANVVYYIRAEWTMPFRYIGFTFVILFFILNICKLRK